MTWPISLAPHAKCYAEQYEESWQEPHRDVMKRHDEADALREEAAFGLFLIGRLRSQPEPRSFADSVSIYNGYLAWHGKTSGLLKSIAASEEAGYKVENAETLRDEFTTVDKTVGDLRVRVATLREFCEGKGLSLKDFSNVI